MKKLKSIIQYECMTSFKYIWMFYAIQYLSVGFISIGIGLVLGNFDDIGTNFLEINTLIYVAILGVLGFHDDFKMLIQNGFTRKYIFIATISMFCFISGTMAFIDTVVANMLHYINSGYLSLYSSLYGYENIFMNWLWLFLLYVAFCSLLYLVRYVFTAEVISDILKLFMEVMGFMANGTINYIFPVLTLLVFVTILAVGSYTIIRRTELG